MGELCPVSGNYSAVSFHILILLHSEGPKLHRVLASLSAIRLRAISIHFKASIFMIIHGWIS